MRAVLAFSFFCGMRLIGFFLVVYLFYDEDSNICYDLSAYFYYYSKISSFCASSLPFISFFLFLFIMIARYTLLISFSFLLSVFNTTILSWGVYRSYADPKVPDIRLLEEIDEPTSSFSSWQNSTTISWELSCSYDEDSAYRWSSCCIVNQLIWCCNL